MKILYIGNFRQSWRTEPQVAHALEECGHRIRRHQLSDRMWRDLPRVIDRYHPEIIFWTHNSRLSPHSVEQQQSAMDYAKSAGVFTASFHLDRYWDLRREYAIYEEPWFKCDIVMTADGGNDDRFKKAGVQHQWVAPAVHGPDCISDAPINSRFKAKVAFVGSWDYYHPEWPWRMEMIRTLKDNYGNDFKLFPLSRGNPIRGSQLASLFSSVDVVVGDSIFAGTDKGKFYWSDRPYETIGRGGVLVFPFTEGLDRHFTDGTDLQYYESQNPKSLIHTIDTLLNSPDHRAHLRMNGYSTIRSNHLYYHRAQEMIQRIVERRSHLIGWLGDCRPGTHDGTVVRETWLDDVYHAKGHVNPGDTVVDIGANVGAFSIWAAKQGANVIAVEPIKENVAQLRKNAELMGVSDRIKVHNVGVGEKQGTVKFDFFDIDKSQSAFRTENGYFEVEIQPLNDFIPDGPVAMLKMDIEGSEIFALRNVDFKNVQRISIETHNTPKGTTHEATKSLLQSEFDLEETGGRSEGYVYGVRK